jgi:hypothetical protein
MIAQLVAEARQPNARAHAGDAPLDGGSAVSAGGRGSGVGAVHWKEGEARPDIRNCVALERLYVFGVKQPFKADQACTGSDRER